MKLKYSLILLYKKILRIQNFKIKKVIHIIKLAFTLLKQDVNEEAYEYINNLIKQNTISNNYKNN